MEEDFFKNELLKFEVNPIVPNKQEQEYIHNKIMDELELGIVKDSTKRELLKIIRRMGEEDLIDGVILGCTELPLILKQEDEVDLKFLNTTKIHVEAIIRELVRRG